jgi:chromosome segregation ATPase
MMVLLRSSVTFSRDFHQNLKCWLILFEGCSDLEKQVAVLGEELESLKKKFERTEKLLEKAEFERDSSSKYVESFREQVSQLHEKLAAERKKNENVEKLVQEKGEDKGL